jgi:putative endonuclease
MSWVYILKTQKDKYYIGSTDNLEQRIRHHSGGYTPSTKRLGFVECFFSQKYDTLKDARYIEKKLKKLKRRDYIEKIIEDGYIKISLPTLR